MLSVPTELGLSGHAEPGRAGAPARRRLLQVSYRRGYQRSCRGEGRAGGREGGAGGAGGKQRE